jgi:hypothetical protein
MKFTMVWEDETQTVTRIDITGGIGFLDYIVPMNEAGGWALLADGNIDVIVNMGMPIPFPARPFPRVRDALMGAPRNITSIIIVSANSVTRMVTQAMLLNPYPELKAKLRLVHSMDAAHALIVQQIKDAHA